MNQFYPNSADPRGRADAWFVNRRSEEAVNCICRRVKASQSQGAGAGWRWGGDEGDLQTPTQHTQAIKMDPGYTYSLEILNEFFETVF